MILYLFFITNFSSKVDGYFTIRYHKEIYLHGSEINFQFLFGEDYDRLLIFLQLPFTSHFNHHFWHHYGDEYIYLKKPMGNLNLKIGRFDIPFSLLKYYETHFLLFQPLYEDFLGYKKNFGAALDGYLKDFVFDINYSFQDLKTMRPIFTLRLGIDQDKFKGGLSFLKDKEKFLALDINLLYLIFDLNGEFLYSFNKKKGIFFAFSFIPFWELETKFSYKYDGKNNILNWEISKDLIKIINLRMAFDYLPDKKFQPIFQINFKI